MDYLLNPNDGFTLFGKQLGRKWLVGFYSVRAKENRWVSYMEVLMSCKESDPGPGLGSISVELGERFDMATTSSSFCFSLSMAKAEAASDGSSLVILAKRRVGRD